MVHFLAEIGADHGIVVDPAAMSTLVQYDWPGNVRELKSVVTRLAVFCEGARLLRSDVLTVLSSMQAIIAPGVPGRMPEADVAAREDLLRVLDACAWDTSVVASTLEIHRVTVYRRMRAFGITAPLTLRRRLHD